MSALKEFVENRLHALGRNAFEAARKGDLDRVFVNDIVKGKKRTVKGENLTKLARALDCSPSDIIAVLGGARPPEAEPQAADDVYPTTRQLIPVRIVGTVEAGAFRAQEDLGDWGEAETIFDTRDDRFPNARILGFEVAGDSMNALKPRPIMAGDRVIGVSFADLDGKVPIRDGMVVVVERTRLGGHEREWSIKQLEIYDDRVEFHPRSTNVRHKPIVVPRDNKADDGTTVEIIALVRRITNEFTW